MFWYFERPNQGNLVNAGFQMYLLLTVSKLTNFRLQANRSCFIKALLIDPLSRFISQRCVGLMVLKLLLRKKRCYWFFLEWFTLNPINGLHFLAIFIACFHVRNKVSSIFSNCYGDVAIYPSSRIPLIYLFPTLVYQPINTTGSKKRRQTTQVLSKAFFASLKPQRAIPLLIFLVC